MMYLRQREADSSSAAIAQLRPGTRGEPEKHHKAIAKIKVKSNPARAEMPKKSEGGAGSGRHGTVGDAIDKHNAKVRTELAKHTVKKETAVQIGMRHTLHESALTPTQGTANKFSVILIQEGMGNLRDCFYYTKDCLKLSAPLFEGVKCFADHADSVQEQIHPERSTRDILGHYENVHYVENNGRGAMAATLVLCEGAHFEWAQSLLTSAIEYSTTYPNGDFVGLSINASGEAGTAPIEQFLQADGLPDVVRAKLEQAQAEGIEEIRPVSILKEATSCDLVTEPGAGGKILAMMERNKRPMPKKKPVKESKEAKEKRLATEARAREAAHEHEESEEHEEGDPDDGAGAAAAGGDGDGDGGDDHADAAQDVALFKKMIQQYLGDDAGGADQEEAMSMAQHAHEHFMKQGMESHEAYEAAGKHLQTSAAIGKSMAPAKGGKNPPPAASDSAEESESHEESEEHEESQTPPPNPKAAGKGAAQEANRMSKDLIKMRAENAKLRESVGRLEVDRYLDKKLASLASERTPDFMKKLREAIGKPQSTAQIEDTCRLFISAYDAGRDDEGEGDAVFTEKAAYQGGKSEGALAGGLGDCLQ